jgi:predicted amidohydrolase YtcJ
MDGNLENAAPEGMPEIFFNGRIYTADEKGSFPEALLVQDGVVLKLGAKEELLNLCGGRAAPRDLKGDTLIPGLVDAHLHPFLGGMSLHTRSLNYEELETTEILSRLALFLEEEEGVRDPDDFLVVNSWSRVPGDDPARNLLDSLKTRRPVFILSADCHFAALNTAALKRFGIDKFTPPPPDGWIRRFPDSEPSGIIEDGPAMRLYDRVTGLTGSSDPRAALRKAFAALLAQGVTTVLDARLTVDVLELLSLMREGGELPLRCHGALEIRPEETLDPAGVERSLFAAARLRERYDSGPWERRPGLSLRHLKFFLDGMPSTGTAYLREPYLGSFPAPPAPEWRPGAWRGRPYFNPGQLEALVSGGGALGFSPHFHAIGDGAVELGIGASLAMRRRHPGRDLRPALAHAEIMAGDLYRGMREADSRAVLSFQWAGESREYLERKRALLGPARFSGYETHAAFLDAGVKTAYGSDWPVDPLDEWGNFQVALTRRAVSGTPANFPRLDNDRDLGLSEVLRAAGPAAAETLGREDLIGSLEPGKFADMVILEGDLFALEKERVGSVKVLETMVGGRTVHRAKGL